MSTERAQRHSSNGRVPSAYPGHYCPACGTPSNYLGDGPCPTCEVEQIVADGRLAGRRVA